MIDKIKCPNCAHEFDVEEALSGELEAHFGQLLIFFHKELFNYDFLILSLITVLISTTSQLGDLFISLLKRKAKVKDTSDILPGHGGFLDRVDGIIFALPMGILLFNLF